MKNYPPVLECIRDLNKKQIEDLLILAKDLKHGVISPIFKHQSIVSTIFLENSTRTKHSFSIAAQRLGAISLDFEADKSSLKKGESLEETLLTLKYQGVSLAVIRTDVSNGLSQFKENPPINIINGGDGINQHPTQALLDLFTMKESGFDPQGKTIAIMGDIKHSRVANSLIELLPMFGCNIILCGPKECLIDVQSNPNVSISTDRDETIKKSDLLYTLRIQKEWHSEKAPYYDQYNENYGVNLENLQKLDSLVPVYHPGPVNIGVELDSKLLKSKYYMGHKQVENSIYMRMALIKSMIDK